MANLVFPPWALDAVAFAGLGYTCVMTMRALTSCSHVDTVSKRPSQNSLEARPLVDRALWYLVLTGVVILVASAFFRAQAVLIPDSAEYLALASRLAIEGRLDFLVDGKELPSRYSPWFSLVFVYPWLRLGVPVWEIGFLPPVFALINSLLVVRIVQLMTPLLPRSFHLLVGAGVFMLPVFVFVSGELLTDLVAMWLTLLSLYQFIRMRDFLADRDADTFRPRPPRYTVLEAGITIALAALVRPLSATLVLPWMIGACTGCRSKKAQSVSESALLLAPLAIAVSVSLLVNVLQFDVPLRTGYQFWCPWPYDYTEFVFSLEYLARNLGTLGRDPVFLLILILACAPRDLVKKIAQRCGEPLLEAVEARSAHRSLVSFVGLGIVTASLLHLVYFYPSMRFFLPLEVVLWILAWSKWRELTMRWSRAAFSVVIIGLAAQVMAQPQVAPTIGALRSRVEACVPNDSVIISSLHPMLVSEVLLRGSNRIFVPTSRSVEFASKVTAAHRISLSDEQRRSLVVPVPPGIDHRQRWLLEGGAREAYVWVAVESPQMLKDLLGIGHRTFLLETGVLPQDRAQLAQAWDLTPVCDGVSELKDR
jgi:hypothetical protein